MNALALQGLGLVDRAVPPSPAIVEPGWVVICGNDKACRITSSARPYELAGALARVGAGLSRRAFVLSGRYDAERMAANLRAAFCGQHLYDDSFAVSVERVKAAVSAPTMPWREVTAAH